MHPLIDDILHTHDSPNLIGRIVGPLWLQPRSSTTMPTPSLNSNFIFPRANARSVLPQPIRPQSKTATTNDKLTMKTRIAVRDANPHRFEVVQLREAVSRVSSPMLKEITPLGNARAQLKTANTSLKAMGRSLPSVNYLYKSYRCKY